MLKEQESSLAWTQQMEPLHASCLRQSGMRDKNTGHMKGLIHKMCPRAAGERNWHPHCKCCHSSCVKKKPQKTKKQKTLLFLAPNDPQLNTKTYSKRYSKPQNQMTISLFSFPISKILPLVSANLGQSHFNLVNILIITYISTSILVNYQVVLLSNSTERRPSLET